MQEGQYHLESGSTSPQTNSKLVIYLTHIINSTLSFLLEIFGYHINVITNIEKFYLLYYAVSSLNVMPEKHLFEFVIDLLQR